MTDEFRIAFDPIYAHPLPEGHRFPMLKYELIPEQLMYEGVITQANLFSPAACDRETILLTHTPGYLDRLVNQELSASEQRRIGFPQSRELTRRELIITQGTIDCCTHAMVHGVSMNVAGGTHHSFADHGEGFCLLNDFAIAANHLLNTKRVSQLLIVDLDVHQGNGSAAIFRDNAAVFTFSMHGANNYPFHKEQSDLDVPLREGMGDDEYLGLLRKHLPELLERVRPELVFFLSGVDVLETDKFGKLRMTIPGCLERDRFVLGLLHRAGIPVVIAMGGGYSPGISTIVDAHCNTFRTAREIFG